MGGEQNFAGRTHKSMLICAVKDAGLLTELSARSSLLKLSGLRRGARAGAAVGSGAIGGLRQLRSPEDCGDRVSSSAAVELVERGGRVIDSSDLLQACWPGQVTSEDCGDRVSSSAAVERVESGGRVMDCSDLLQA